MVQKPVFHLLGMGTAVPPHSISQEEAAKLAQGLCCRTEHESERLSTLYRHTQVNNRGSVLLNKPNGADSRQTFFPPTIGEPSLSPTTDQRMTRYAQEAGPLALAASRQAMRESSTNPEDIAHLVSVSCTGFAAPGVDIALIKGLHLSPDVSRTHIGFMGCHGALNGLRAASSLAASQPDSRVLLCAVELCSLHFYCGWDMEKVVANALFADGAASVIIGQPENTADGGWKAAAHGSFIFPDSEKAMSWRIRDHGFEMTLSPQVPALIGSHLKPWIDRWLSALGFSLSDVRSWAIHPGGPKILSVTAQALEIGEAAVSASREVLAEYGNMSSPTLLFILKRLKERSSPRPCVALGFGPGLAVEALLLT